MQFQVLPVNHENYKTHPQLKYDNVVPIPEVFIPSILSTKPYRIRYGGRVSAKSWTTAAEYLLDCAAPTYSRQIFARMTQKAARESQFQLFKDLMKRYPLFSDVLDVKETNMRITNKINGNYIQGGSFEQPETLMSVPEVTRVWIEEPIHRRYVLSEAALEDIVGTIQRGSDDIASQVDMTFNPINKSNFIYEKFFKEKVYDAHICKADYIHNPFCPEKAKARLERLKISNPAQYQVDALGNWGTVLTGFEYYGNFNRTTAAKKIPVQAVPIHITFDFNVMPYMTAIVNQIFIDPISGKVQFHALKEYCLKPPHSTIEATCAAILKDWEQHIRKHGCYVYGDPQAHRRTVSAEARTLIHSIEKNMRGYVNHTNLRIANTYRRHTTTIDGGIIGRYELMQRLMSGLLPCIYTVDPDGCPLLLEDYESVLIDANGGKSKKKTKEGGIQFEKHGHTSDAQDYFLSWHMKYQFNM